METVAPSGELEKPTLYLLPLTIEPQEIINSGDKRAQIEQRDFIAIKVV